MTTQQSYALYLADELELGTFVPNVLQNEAALRQRTAAELRRQHARITELEAQLAQRFDAADMATAAAQGFRDGATAPAQPVAEPAKADSVLEDALSDSVRVPLDSLHADAAYLIGRLREGSMPYARVIEIIRERIDAAKAAIRARASHGQAPAGATKPTEQQILEAAEKAGLWPNTVHSWIPAFHRYHKELAKAQSAPARADSVLEDAARYQLLRRGQHWSVIDGGGNELLNEALDHEVDAARKQGATP